LCSKKRERQKQEAKEQPFGCALVPYHFGYEQKFRKQKQA
jgi:hypothetical protein